MKRWLLSKLGLAKAPPHREERVDLSSYEIVDASITMGKSEEEQEPIVPIEIRHNVDEVVFDGKREQRYNFIDYHFEKYGAYCRARTYLDEIEAVSLYGPSRSREEVSPVEAPQLREEVLAYLKRRFMAIDVLGEEGYVELWRHPRFERRC